MGISILVLVAASFIVFVLVALSGNPLGPLEANPHVPAATIRAREIALNLDKPLLQRYWIWVSGIFHGSLGTDLQGNAVAPRLLGKLAVTLRYFIPATVLSLVVAMAVGAYGAVRHRSIRDHLTSGVSFLFLSTPVFVIAVVLKDFVAVPLNHSVGRVVLFTVGQQSPLQGAGIWARVGNYSAHTALLVVTLVIVTYASWSRYQRASMLDILNSDYVRLARAKGLSPRRVLVRHVMRNSLLPLVTVVAMDSAMLLGGAVVAEQVFGWDAMGQLLLQGSTSLDVNVVQAWLLVASAVVILFNLAADILYGWLDPRVRHA